MEKHSHKSAYHCIKYLHFSSFFCPSPTTFQCKTKEKQSIRPVFCSFLLLLRNIVHQIAQ